MSVFVLGHKSPITTLHAWLKSWALMIHYIQENLCVKASSTHFLLGLARNDSKIIICTEKNLDVSTKKKTQHRTNDKNEDDFCPSL